MCILRKWRSYQTPAPELVVCGGIRISDYIRREAAIYSFFPVDPENDGSDGATPIYLEQNYSSNEIESILWELPAADVEPVRHGRWGKKQGGFWEFANCSVCEQKTATVGIPPNYCPNCGAKMKMEDKPKGEKN